MNLNILGRVVEYLIEDLDGMTDLSVTGKYFCFGNLSDDEGVVECRRAKIKRAGCADRIGRIRLDNVVDAKIVETLKMKRLVGLQSRKLLQRGDRFLVVALSHRRFDQR